MTANDRFRTMMTPLEAPASTATVSATAGVRALRDLDPPEDVAPSSAGSDGNGSRPRDARASISRVAPHGSGLYAKVERIYDGIEAFVSRLSVRDNFWNSVCSLIWLPLAFFSGIRLKALSTATKAFDTAADAASDAVTSARDRVAASRIAAAAVLPFRRFNRNWYRAMAGGALLANSEIAGGMYVFGIVGGDYTVVCKHLEYRFLRPCFGPAVYRMTPREDVYNLVEAGGEFNVTVDMEIQQQASRLGEKDKRVGQCIATFHVTPKVHHKTKRQRSRGR